MSIFLGVLKSQAVKLIQTTRLEVKIYESKSTHKTS
jgi:hypothetical protein